MPPLARHDGLQGALTGNLHIRYANAILRFIGRFYEGMEVREICNLRCARHLVKLRSRCLGVWKHLLRVCRGKNFCNSSRHSGLLFDILRVELVSFICQLEHELFAEPAWFRTLQVDSWLDWCEMELSSPPPQPEQASGMDRSSFGEASM